MDMWDPFIARRGSIFPELRTKIVFDRFHIMKHMTEAVDAVRQGRTSACKLTDDDTLKGTKYLWFFSEENVAGEYEERFARLKPCT